MNQSGDTLQLVDMGDAPPLSLCPAPDFPTDHAHWTSTSNNVAVLLTFGLSLMTSPQAPPPVTSQQQLPGSYSLEAIDDKKRVYREWALGRCKSGNGSTAVTSVQV